MTSEIPAARLAAAWNLPSAYTGVVTTDRVTACRWQHSMKELESVIIPVNTLFYRFAPTRAIRLRGRRSEASTYERHGLGILAEGSDGRWLYQDDVDILHIYYAGRVLNELSGAEGGAAQVILKDQIDLRDPVLRVLCKELAHACEAGADERLYVDSLTVTIGMRLLRSHSASSQNVAAPGRARPGGLAPWQVNRVCEKMRAGLDQEISLQSLASDLRLSPFHFARSFKSAVGVPPHRYLAHLRLTEAQKLLRQTQLPVSEVAARVGYSDDAYFGRAFKRFCGQTPSSYRREVDS